MAKILLVEDDPLVRTVVTQMIEAGGHEVLIGRQGRQALADVLELTFDLLITDIVMPDVSGWELIETLRKFKPETPAIAISGGGVGFTVTPALARPFELDRLLELIEATLKRRFAARARRHNAR